jgi:hypothetical protein
MPADRFINWVIRIKEIRARNTEGKTSGREWTLALHFPAFGDLDDIYRGPNSIQGWTGRLEGT